MAEATPATIDYDKLAQAMTTAVAAAQKPLLDRLSTLETQLSAKTTSAENAAHPVGASPAGANPAGATATASTDAKPLTADDVAKLLDARDQKRADAANVANARSAFIAEKMKGVPPAYADKLPQSSDPAVLAAAEQSIRAQMQADFRAAGISLPAVSGEQPANGTTAVAGVQAVDTTKMSGSQLIDLGLKLRSGQSVKNPADANPATRAAGASLAGAPMVSATRT